MEDDQIDACLDLLRLLPPSQISAHLTSLLSLAPSLTESLLAAVDQPLVQSICSQTGKPYLRCDYNRDGDSYRSPWSNEYDPACPDGTRPSTSTRALEQELNDAFSVYADLYFEGSTVSSVYTWDLDAAGFAAAILIKKKEAGSCWDSIHVIEAIPQSRVNTHYKLTSTIILSLGSGDMTLGGNVTRQSEFDGAEGTVVDVGRIVEEMEGRMRGSLAEIYFGKTMDIAGSLRGVVLCVLMLGVVDVEAKRIQETIVQGLSRK